MVQFAMSFLIGDTLQNLRPGVIESYTQALKLVYVVGIAYGTAALISAVFVKNINIKAQATPTEAAGSLHGEAGTHGEKAV
jgi:hypothetical protein